MTRSFHQPITPGTLRFAEQQLVRQVVDVARLAARTRRWLDEAEAEGVDAAAVAEARSVLDALCGQLVAAEAAVGRWPWVVGSDDPHDQHRGG